ncbi:MAG: hypothetical protein O3A53_16325 [Acidobacteria bacterium]|nr:hypothetical protein [Acidobacteriota bacterium]MDA1236351.1 hypothetical protein [Acidobacteriota bacterium]
MKITQIIAGALVSSLSLVAVPLSAAEHLAPVAEVRQRLTEKEQARSQNVSELTKFFETPVAQQALAKSGMDATEVIGAVTSLDDESLEALASRAIDAQHGLSAGALSNQQLTYIIISLGTAVLILVIVAA